MRSLEDVQENLRRGFIDLMILSLLAREDMYGYQLNQEIEKRTKGKMVLLVGSMYSPLRRMIENKEVTERREMAGARRFRIYYHIEAPGLEYLNMLIHEYHQMTQSLDLLIEPLEAERD